MTQYRPWTQTDAAYLAGIIDGEGCFCLHNFGTHRFGCALAVGNTDLRMLEWIRVRFGGTVKIEKRSNIKHKPFWRWKASADDLESIISAVLPYLVTKKDRAELILAYRATLPPRIRTKRSTSNTPEHVKRERILIHSALSDLNKRGAA